MAWLPQEIIRRKRDGGTLSGEEIAWFVAEFTAGRVSAEQASALAMAVFFNGMATPERVALTLAMRDSGSVLAWDDLPGPALDKHSTGGVGDTVSLMLGPAVAAAGGFVPMISGRGLGHTGGTLDKFDSIPGYATQPDNALFRKVVREAGCAIIGQTADLAPADKRLYAIRDVTATVESVPLITASILSKKLAAGLHGLAMDVKTGSGAFMPTLDASRELARSLVSVAVGAGLPTTALITAMDQPLADAAGNAVEMAYAVDYLTARAANRACTRSWWRWARRCCCSAASPPRKMRRARRWSGRSRRVRRPSASRGWWPDWAARATSWSGLPRISPPRRWSGPCMPGRPARSRRSTRAPSGSPSSRSAAGARAPTRPSTTRWG